MASAALIESDGRSVIAMPLVASTPSSLVARSVKVPAAGGTTITGLACTTPGAGSMLTVLAPRTAYENVTAAPTSGFGWSTVKLSITGGGGRGHAARAKARSSTLFTVALRTSPAGRSDRPDRSG